MSYSNDSWRQLAQQNLLIASNASAAAAEKSLADANHARILRHNAESREWEANKQKQILEGNAYAANEEKLKLEKKIKADEEKVNASKKIHAENERYRALLARPLIDVLQENTDLKKAYEEQQKLLNRWVVSQKAFRNLAFKFKKELGISDEKIKVLIDEEYSKVPEIPKLKTI